MSKKQQDYSRTYRSLQIGFRVFIIWRCLRVSASFQHSTNHQVVGNGGAYRDRTDDPLLAKQVLSQLS